MNRNRIEGTANQAKGAIKQTFGKATGNTRLEAEGAVQKTGGKVQRGFGGFLDSIRNIFRRY